MGPRGDWPRRWRSGLVGSAQGKAGPAPAKQGFVWDGPPGRAMILSARPRPGRPGFQTMKTILLAALCLGMIAPVRAADPGPSRLDNWHHWRGPEANGTAPRADPPVTWDSEKNVK